MGIFPLVETFHILESRIWNSLMLQPFDLLLALKMAVSPSSYTQAQLAVLLGVSASQVNRALKSCIASGLLDAEHRRVIRPALEEFAVHGARYAFPGELGPVTRGMPTALSAKALTSQMGPSSAVYVWPTADGDARGESVKPFYKTVPYAAMQDSNLYEAAALLEAIRIGRARERNLAATALSRLIRKPDD